MDDLENELRNDEDMEDGEDFSDDESTDARIRATPPLVKSMCKEKEKESGFRQSTRVCLELIRQAMLDHRWQKAAEYMACYPQVLEDTDTHRSQKHKELVWRISTEILHHLPNSTMMDYNNVYERMKNSGVRHYLMICMEQSFHLMLHGQIEDAKRQLSGGESWRYGKESAAQHKKIKLIQAYRSLLDYLTWCDKKFSTFGDKHVDADVDQSIHSYFRQAAVNLQEILKNPGVWDPFILSYVEMLEFYEDHEEAVKVLNNYASDSNFPPNPNAHVYLYQYLKRHKAEKKKLMKVLKHLSDLVPSHELMLEYTSLLLNSEEGKAVQTALNVVLEMLDYACWRRNLDVWKNLEAIIQKLEPKENCKDVIEEKMALRKEWWPKLHFTSFHAKQDSKENPELFQVKSSLVKVLCPDLPFKYSVEQATKRKV